MFGQMVNGPRPLYSADQQGVSRSQTPTDYILKTYSNAINTTALEYAFKACPYSIMVCQLLGFNMSIILVQDACLGIANRTRKMAGIVSFFL